MNRMECLNFEPRAEFLNYATMKMEELAQQSPSDASLSARAFFEADRFVLELTVEALSGRFRSAVGVPIPKDHPRGRLWQSAAFDEVFSEITRQLNRWRKQRRFPQDAA